MEASRYFLDTAAHGGFVHGSHHPGLVLLSIFVSIFSATMALQTAQIARRTERALYRHIALVTGAIALGGGVWTTHFIGMLAFELPTSVHYSTGWTLFSLMPACVASWLALRIMARASVSSGQLAFSGALVGLGIGAMHYSGMAAMRTPLEMRYEPVTFAFSIAVAIVLAILALWVRFGLQRTRLAKVQRFVAGGVVMGLAIASMHYMGMASVRFIGEPGVAQSGLMLNAVYASFVLSSFTITVTVMVAAINGMIRSHELVRRLEEGSSRLRATLDTAVDGIITIDTRGIIQDFNRSAERLFGWAAGEVKGRNIKMLMPEPYQSAHDGYLHNYMTSGKAKIIGVGREVVGMRKDGSHMPMRLAVGRVELEGELLFVGFVTDISDRHALEASLRETAQRAEQAAAAKSTFLANMSHEIRTPMNSIIGFTELLLQEDATPVQRNHLNTIRQSSRSLLRLINDILDTTKLEKGRLELESIDFSLKAVAMQVESSLRLAALAKGLELVCHYPEAMPVYFKGDPLRLLQVLNNLVGNAIKFTERGRVEVLFSHGPGLVHVHVRDTGIGMTAQQLESIFAPFTQADASISRRFGGTGLGTTIARQLVELMGGGIEVDSEPGRGSTFSVRLPLPTGQAPAKASLDTEVAGLPPLHILIADDVPQNVELLALTLARHGHTTELARDGDDALRKFFAGRFDVILMDVHMPGLDGLQATRLIRQHERSRGLTHTPVIALTASVMAEDRLAAREAGMDGFSLKPLDAVALFNEIARVLGSVGGLGGGAGAVPSRASGPSPSDGGASLGSSPVAVSAAVDWERGIALWGDEHRLADALRRFLDSAHSKYPLPRSLLTDVDREQLRFSLHGIRGAAGNLALTDLAMLAGRMEDNLRAGRHDEVSAQLETMRTLLEATRHAMSLPVAASRSESEPEPMWASVPGSRQVVWGAPPPASSSAEPSDAWAEALRHLHGVVRRSEMDDGALDTVCAGLEGRGEGGRAKALRAALDAFEFRDALVLLEQCLAEQDCGVSS